MMSGVTFRASSPEFWAESKTGGGWAFNTLAVLLVILVCQLAGKARFWLRRLKSSSASFFSTGDRFKYASVSVTSPPSSVNELSVNKNNPAISPSSEISEIVTDTDLQILVDTLDGSSHQSQKWDTVIDKQNSQLSYSAKSYKPKDGPLTYMSVTTFENCSAELLRDFYMDNNYRKKWDKTVIEYETLQVDESKGTEIGRTIKKFPLLTAREYIVAWRAWEANNRTFYCVSKECEHPLAPRQKKYVRVGLFRSGWQIRPVPGRNACEIRLVHQEDAGLNVEMAKMAFAKGIWSYVCKMDAALRSYTPQSSFIMTKSTLAQKAPEQIDNNTTSIPGPSSEVSLKSTLSPITSQEGVRERKILKRPSCKLVANGLILLGGVICLSRGHSALGAKVAAAYILTKLTKRGASSGQKKQS